MPSDDEQHEPHQVAHAFNPGIYPESNLCTEPMGRYRCLRERKQHSLFERLAASLAREARLREALPDPAKLWSLAEWLEMKYPGDPNPEIQDDLRAWAKTIYATDPAKYGTYWVQAICDEEARAAAAPAAGGQQRDGDAEDS